MNTQNPFKETEDRLEFAKALDRARASKSHATFTDFMNPQRCVVFLQQFMKMDVDAGAYGGYEDAERKMLGFGISDPAVGHGKHEPDGEYPNTFPITPLAITYNGRFSRQLTHRDFLGAVLGLGLTRGKIGDIRMGEDGAIMYVSNDVAAFITESLHEVGRTSVTATPHTEVPGIEETGTEKRITAASLRLDAVISMAFHLSRGKAAALIEAEKVFVNWAIAKKTRELREGDIVTARQIGRLRVDSIIGATKKDRVALIVTLY